MANFAQLDEDNKVINVIVISNDEILDENGDESEELGIAKCKEILGQDTNWVQTSYNNNVRGRYAQIGGYYLPKEGVFTPRKSYDSWKFDVKILDWVAPIAIPTDAPEGKDYTWDEETLSWVLFDLPVIEEPPAEEPVGVATT
jgi:hypothetical protein